MTDALYTPTAQPPRKSPRPVWGWFILLFIGAAIVYGVYAFPDLRERLGITPHENASTEVTRLTNDVTELRRHVATLETRLDAMQESVKTLPAATPTAPNASVAKDASHVQDDIASLTSVVAAMKLEIEQSAANSAQARDFSQNLLAAVLTFIPLREAAQSGHSFTDELAGFRTATQHQPALHDAAAKLEPFAEHGVPTWGALRENLIAHQSDAQHAADKAQAEHWWQRILIELQSLISIRPLHGDVTADAFSDLSSSLAKADPQAALDAFKALPSAAQETLMDLKAEIEARKNLDDAMHTLAAQLTATQRVAP